MRDVILQSAAGGDTSKIPTPPMPQITNFACFVTVPTVDNSCSFLDTHSICPLLHGTQSVLSEVALNEVHHIKGLPLIGIHVERVVKSLGRTPTVKTD